MAEDKHRDDESQEDSKLSSDSGLGNLPPLSDFDSRPGSPSDSGLPPLGDFDSGVSDQGGLPPISDIDVETPEPTGGYVRPAPPGFDSGRTASSGPKFSSSSGFQDLAADSDFSPETPEIGPGPGPDINVDTPMFDSAFGGPGSGMDANMRTPAPTQAMETPMFGGSQPSMGGGGFDQGAFGEGMDFGGGTPAPDFSPDTDLQQAPPQAAGPKATKKGGGGGGNKAVAAMVALLIGVIVGILVGPMALSYLPFELPVPNPVKVELTAAQSQIDKLRRDLDEYRRMPQPSEQVSISPDELAKLEDDIRNKTSELSQKSADLDRVSSDLEEQRTALRAIEQDISDKTEEFVQAQEMFEDLQNETAIVQARQKGLIAEVDRLTGLVGELEVANQRSVAVKKAMETSMDRLIIQVKEGMPLTPEKFNHGARLQRVEQLRQDLASAKYVTPELQSKYTDLYINELRVAAAREYFFARLPVTDQFGNRVLKWAECVMNGNWSVYYRTLDGKNVGVYQNLTVGGAPEWGFKEDLPVRSQREIEERVMAARVPGYEEKIQVLAQKEVAALEGSSLQRTFESL